MDFLGQALRFLSERKQAVIAVAVAVVLISAGWVGWTFYRQSQDRAAAERYSQAMALYYGGKHRESLPVFAQVAAYRSSIYGLLALVHQAHAYVALHEYPQAVEALREFLRRDGNPLFRQIGLVNLGYVYELSGRCAEALEPYMEGQKLDGALRDEAILGHARCSAQNGMGQAALESYRRYLAANPESERATEITLRIQELENGASRSPASQSKPQS